MVTVSQDAVAWCPSDEGAAPQKRKCAVKHFSSGHFATSPSPSDWLRLRRPLSVSPLNVSVRRKVNEVIKPPPRYCKQNHLRSLDRKLVGRWFRAFGISICGSLCRRKRLGAGRRDAKATMQRLAWPVRKKEGDNVVIADPSSSPQKAPPLSRLDFFAKDNNRTRQEKTDDSSRSDVSLEYVVYFLHPIVAS